MNCATCRHRWYGVSLGTIAQWHCRKNKKHRRLELPVIGTDEQLQASKRCGEWAK